MPCSSASGKNCRIVCNFKQIHAFYSRCDHATISILPARAVVFRVPTVSHSETKNSIYNTQRKYTRCGAVCSGTSRAPAYDWGQVLMYEG